METGEKRVACYTRVSSVEQVQGFSLDAQRKAIALYCEQRGWTDLTWFSDQGRSAFNEQRQKRPAFDALLAGVENFQFDIVIVHGLDRWSRNMLSALREFDTLKKYRVDFISIQEQYDFSTPMGRIFFNLLCSFAEYYSTALGAHVRKGIVEKREQGEHVGGIPWAALRVAGKLVVNPDCAGTLALVLELARDRSPQAVAQELNRRAIPSPHGARWWPETIRKTVRNGAWLATQPDPWPDRWREAARRPPLPRVGDPRRNVRELSGLLRCACGGSMQYSRTWSHPDGSAANSVRCRKRAYSGDVAYCPGGRHTSAEGYVAQAEAYFFALPNMADFRRLPGGTGASARAAIGQRRQSLVLALAEGLATDEYYRRKAELDREEALLPPVDGQLIGLLQEIQIAQDGWGTLAPAQKNAIWRLLFEKVVARGATAEAVPSKALAALLAALG